MARVKMNNNLETVGSLLGSLKGIGDGLDDPEYMEGLIQQAHGKAANAFNVAAAATGSTGHLSHMFEFGVPGITRGPSKFPDPTSQAARLWKHTIVGNGGSHDIGFTFRPALNRNPQPTTRDTGVPSKYLRKLSKRKYIFWNKAFVMESGQTVEIKSRQKHGKLFVPTPGNYAPKFFLMWNAARLGPITAKPGTTSQGNFTAFWVKWWASQGQSIIDKSIRTSVQADISTALKEARKAAATKAVKPASTNNIHGTASRARAKMKKLFDMREERTVT